MLSAIPIRQPCSSMSALLVFLLLMLVVRSIMAVTIPLWCDEAYYSIWAEQLEWGYNDHPPMIAWWIRLGQTILGDNIFGIRLIALLTSIANSLGIYLLAREFGVDKTSARRAGAWVQTIWLIALTGMLALPDAAVTFFWIFTCLCVARAARLDSTRWWIAAGAMAGLACMSKYTALFLAPGILLWLVSSPRYRSQLLRPGPWLAILSALAVFAPNIVWNAQNDWASFSLQFGRAVPETLSLARPLAFLLLQFIFLGPLIFWLALTGLRHTLKSRSDNSAIAQCRYFAACSSLPLIAYMLVHGFHSSVGGHWLALIYPQLALIAALNSNDLIAKYHLPIIGSAIIAIIAAGPLLAYSFFTSLLDKLTPLNISILLLIIMATIMATRNAVKDQPPEMMRKTSKYLLPAIGLAIIAEITFLATRYNETRQSLSWPELSSHLSEQASQYGAGWIGAGSFQDASLLYKYMPPTGTKTAQINERYRYPASHHSWTINTSQPGIFISSSSIQWQGWGLKPEQLRQCFREITQLPSEYVADFAGTRHEYKLYLLASPSKNWIKDGC